METHQTVVLRPRVQIRYLPSLRLTYLRVGCHLRRRLAEGFLWGKTEDEKLRKGPINSTHKNSSDIHMKKIGEIEKEREKNKR